MSLPWPSWMRLQGPWTQQQKLAAIELSRNTALALFPSVSLCSVLCNADNPLVGPHLHSNDVNAAHGCWGSLHCRASPQMPSWGVITLLCMCDARRCVVRGSRCFSCCLIQQFTHRTLYTLLQRHNGESRKSPTALPGSIVQASAVLHTDRNIYLQTHCSKVMMALKQCTRHSVCEMQGTVCSW